KSALWLKMIGTSEKPCPDSYDRDHVDFGRRKRPARMRPGDLLILYAVGGTQRVFALATVTSEPYATGNARWAHRVDISYKVNVPVPSGVHISKVNTPRRDLRQSLQRHSHIELDTKEYDKAASRLRQRFEHR